MADNILIKGDMVNFMPAFAPANVVPRPGQLKASASKVRINGKAVCLAGDEKKVNLAGCMYMAATFTIPGAGALKIASLGGDQKSKKVRCQGKAMLLKGRQFQGKCQISSPAQMPSPTGPVPDPNPQYMGQGMFVAVNQNVKAS